MSIVRDPYINRERGLRRIRKEYETHGKLIIAVDFDDTIYNTHKQEGWVYQRIVEVLLRWAPHAYIICWTASLPERYDFIRNVFDVYGIRLDAINENAPEIDVKGPKIFASVYLDDRSFGLENAIWALETLATMKGF